MRKIVIRGSLLGIFLFVLVGCTVENRTPMRIGTNLWPGYEPLYLARELQYWTEDDIKLAEFPSASEVIRAFRNKSLDAAALTLDEVLLLWQQNIQAEVVLVLDVSNGADVIIANADVNSFSDLRGKKIAVESSALGAYVISRALEINGMSLDEISIVPMGVSDHGEAFKNGKVQAAVNFEPVRTKLLEMGGKEVFTSREIPGEIVDVLVIQRSYLEQHPEQGRVLAKAWFQAIQYMQKNRQDSAERIATRQKLTPEEVLASYEGLDLAGWDDNVRMLIGEGGSLNQTLKKLSDSMLKAELLDKEPPLNAIINDSLVR